ncbi:MAG: hypothetical protein K1Y02_00440 [Candidatus Hydrogenedentes bacterium]|nr:hypothetical protein [Candidatus Hydrogenedentota bacterium]
MKTRNAIPVSRFPRQAAVIRRNTGDTMIFLWSILNWILWLFFGYQNPEQS